MMAAVNKITWRTGVIAGALICMLLLYFPWGAVLHTGIAVPGYLGWALLGGLLLMMAAQPQVAVCRSRLLLLALVLLSLPLAWMPAHADVWRAVTRVLALWGGAVWLLWLGARPLTESQAGFTGRVMLLTGAIGALSVMVRVFWPTGYAVWLPLVGGGWATGGHLQPDLMATFLATALIAGLHAWLFQGRRRVLPVLSGLMFALTLCQSQTGLLSVGVVMLLMLIACVRGRRHRMLCGAGMVLAGFLAGVLCLIFLLHMPVVLPFPWVLQSWLFRACFALMAQHPLLGVGYGLFEGSLPDGVLLAGLGGLYQPHTVVTHPGNEVLYWVTEGGVFAGIGMVLLLVSGSRLLVRLWRQARRVGGYGQLGSDALSWALCALPLFFHSLTGMPWYQSPLHYLLFLLFAGMAIARLSPLTDIDEPGPAVARGLRVAVAIAGLAVLWYAVAGTQVAVSLQVARQTMARDVRGLEAATAYAPGYLPDEVGFALAVNRLQQFNTSHDTALLAQAETFLKDYLRRHPDPNVYSLLITALDRQGRSDEAEAVYQDGQRRVPWDKRFTPDADTTPVSAPDQPARGGKDNHEGK